MQRHNFNTIVAGSAAGLWFAKRVLDGGIVLLLAAVSSVATADEGIWTFDNLPAKALQAKHSFATPATALSVLRDSAVRLGDGSGAFVSADGLIITNQHVAMSCAQRLSSATEDLVRNGFQAATRSAERQCPGGEARRLESTDDVTPAVRSAVRSQTDEAANAERNAAIASIERECGASTGLRCEVVTLYRGAAYHVYRYRVWTDVRLVFVPELQAANFGGDPDNFVFPRFDLDIAFVRAYEDGKPVRSPNFLKLARKGVEEGDLVFAAGHPGSTKRLATLDQIQLERDVGLPLDIANAQRQLAILREVSAASPESARRALGLQLGYENWLKSMRGQLKALQDPALIATKSKQETELRKAFAPPSGQADPWNTVARAMQAQRELITQEEHVGYGYGTLFQQAGTLVELAGEASLPESERLAAYRPSAVSRRTLRVTAATPYYKDVDIARLAGYWQAAQDALGKDHPYVRRVLGDKTPTQAATAAIEGTRIDLVEERKRLLDGGAAAIAASTDPLVVLARDVYPMRRSLLKRLEVEVETPTLLAADAIEKMRYQSLGTDAYPDATFTLRLSYGTVRGYDADGVLTPWQTNFWGLYGRSAAFGAKPPFHLAAHWTERQRTLDLSTPLNFVATIDIVGGSSGSPIVTRNGDLVGVVFDSNLEGLAAHFAYTDAKARAIAVDVRAVVEALDKIYEARGLLAELGR